MTAAISALWVYPVKACKGVALERSLVDRRGLRHDRRWMIVDAEARFVTQRTEPRLALVAVAFDAHELVLAAGGAGELRVPILPPEGAVRRRVHVWRDEVDAVDCGAEAARWVSHWLGSTASLVYMPEDVRRPVNPKHALASDVVSFADAFPLLIASTSSLDDLNARMDSPVPMDRFRPNVVVSGCAAWAEDEWRRVCVGDLPVRVAKACERCVVTTTNQQTAERGLEPMRTLATFRRRGDGVIFAQNGVPDGAGSIAVGDDVVVLEQAIDPQGPD